MPGELRSLAELDEVKDGEDSEDREEVTADRGTTALGAPGYVYWFGPPLY